MVRDLSLNIPRSNITELCAEFLHQRFMGVNATLQASIIADKNSHTSAVSVAFASRGKTQATAKSIL